MGPPSERLFKSDAWPTLGDVKFPSYTVNHGRWSVRQLGRCCCCCCCCNGSSPVPPKVGKISCPTSLTDLTHSLGRFVFTWSRSVDDKDTVLTIAEGGATRVLWSSIPGRSFVGGASVRLQIYEERGSVEIKEGVQKVYANQSVEKIEAGPHSLTVSGRISGKAKPGENSPRYALTFRVSECQQRVLAFQLDIDGERVNQAHFVVASDAEEHIFGFGEQFSFVDCKGHEIPVVTEEGGIGRGDAGLAITRLLGVTGEAFSSYCPSPHLISHRGRSLFLTNTEPSTFDLRPDDWFRVRVHSSRMRGCLLAGQNPLEAVEVFTGLVGRMPPLPDWVHRGAIVGLQGGTDRVRKVWADLKRLGSPIAGFWLQDWVGQRKTIIGKQLWWNWTLDLNRYPGWNILVKELDAEGIAMGIYVNPFLVNVPEKQLAGRRNLYKEALRWDYLVLDPHGKPYQVPNTDFSASLVDISNDQARKWFKHVIKSEMLGIGAKFWMADFGEAAQFDGKFRSGESGLTYHNRYPVEWARLNREVIEESGKSGEAWFFTRAGFLNTPAYTTAMWLGDQNVTWGKNDGLPSAVNGMVSGGFSGLSINHSDVGGYTSVGNPLVRIFGRGYVRSKELLVRWMEANAFTALFRTHEGNEPDRNVQFYTDEDTLSSFARWSKVYAALGRYREKLVKEAAEKGYPVVRHPIMHYPNDKNLYNPSKIDHSFMLGHLVFVSPVVRPKVSKKKVYLPAGTWVHLWTGKTFGAPDSGIIAKVDTPLGKPAVFYSDCEEAKYVVSKELKKIGVLEEGPAL